MNFNYLQFIFFKSAFLTNKNLIENLQIEQKKFIPLNSFSAHSQKFSICEDFQEFLFNKKHIKIMTSDFQILFTLNITLLDEGKR